MIPTIKLIDFNNFAKSNDSWFNPAVTRLADGRWLATMLTINGNDFFGDPMFSISADEGRSWTTPSPISSLASVKFPEIGVRVAVCDTHPFTSPSDGTVFVFGCTVHYSPKGNVCWDKEFDKSRLPKELAVYATWHPETGWSERKTLPLPGWESDYRTAATQLAFMPDGKCIIPIYMTVSNGIYCGYQSHFFGVTAPVYKQNGDFFEPVKTARVFTNSAGRGFVEPSAVRLADGSYAMTIRAEDGNMYVSNSHDGFEWSEPTTWRWDDGTPLVTDSTQQHWVRIADKVFLLFTMKYNGNDALFRFRAPLLIAEAIPQEATLVHDTLRTVFERQTRNGVEAFYGNFHCTQLDGNNALVTDAALFQQQLPDGSRSSTTKVMAAIVS